MLIDVLIPFHRCDKYFFESVASLLHSNFQDFSILLIDDRMNLSHSSQLDELLMKKSIKYFRNSNHGYGNSLNLGISKSDSKFIALMNADDLVHPNRLKEQVSEFFEMKCDVVTTKLQKFSGRLVKPQLAGYFTSPDFDPLQLLFGSYSANASSMYKRSWLSDDKRFLNSYMADYLFALQNYENARVRFINQDLYYYRQHRLQATSQTRAIPNEIFAAWKLIAAGYNFPTISTSTITCLALPFCKPEAIYTKELENWIAHLENSILGARNFSKEYRDEYSFIVFRRLLAATRYNPKIWRIALKYFTPHQAYLNISSILKEMSVRKKFRY
jgi:glycosyltransferase involved in cell wall biosynthesis